MILYIAEKPSLARAIAAALPQPQKKEDGCIWLPNGDCVSWCIGHLLEQAEPHAYNSALKAWNFDTLPIIPDTWQWQEKAQTRKQLTILKKLIRRADKLVHAGDPDREGQLLVDEVIFYCQVPKSKQSMTERLLINDLTPSAVKKALANVRLNSEFSALSRSALARSRADWLFGINLTRAYTIKGREAGYNGVLSVGRVQTPILGLVVKRDEEINQFIPTEHFQVLAHLKTHSGEAFTAKWQPSDACVPHMDSEGHVLNKALALNVAQRITDTNAQVVHSNYPIKKQNAPLPFSLSALQIEAANQFGMSAQQVLDCCQNLYEKHQLITYPRSDCQYIPLDQLRNAPAILNTIKNNVPSLELPIQQANLKLKSKAWNDSKVQAHHAIIPTQKAMNVTSLPVSEKQLYELISKQYLVQFYPPYQYMAARIELKIEGGTFIATGHTPIEIGWKSIFKNTNRSQTTHSENSLLPKVSDNDVIYCLRGEVCEKITAPPKAFTDATLLAAMTGISRFVTNKDIKAILRETDGLGTEATRASIIELLFHRGFLTRQKGKTIVSTATGQALIKSLPDALIVPDMTAKWESTLNKISSSEVSYNDFMTPLEKQLTDLVQQSKKLSMGSLQHLPSPVKKRRKSTQKTRKKSTSI